MKKKISKQKLTLGLALCLFAPIGISFIASCGNGTQTNTNVSQHAENVLNSVVENTDTTTPNITKIKEQYPSYYYASYIQPNLGITGSSLGTIPKEYLINTVIQNEGLFNYTPTATIDGKEESFTITCADITKANDLTGELSLSVYITHNNESLGHPTSSRKTFDFLGFKKLANANDLFLQSGETNKTDKFYLDFKDGKSLQNVISGIKASETKTKKTLDTYINAATENEVVISGTQLNTIIGSDFLKRNFMNNSSPFFSTNTTALTQKVPTVEQGGGSFYTYSPFYIDIITNEFTKMTYDKTTKKLSIYFDVNLGTSVGITNKQEFSLDVVKATVTPPPY